MTTSPEPQSTQSLNCLLLLLSALYVLCGKNIVMMAELYHGRRLGTAARRLAWVGVPNSARAQPYAILATIGLTPRRVDPNVICIRLLFCLFAEDIGLLPNDPFMQLIERIRKCYIISFSCTGVPRW